MHIIFYFNVKFFHKTLAIKRLLIDSIMFRLVQIAENGEKLTLAFKEKHSEIQWKAIKGMRNRIVHDYGVVDMTIVFNTVCNSIPKLYKQLKDLL